MEFFRKNKKRGVAFSEKTIKMKASIGGEVSFPTFCAGLAELADAMDSKSIARKGVPVRLRDPVLNPGEISVSSGFYLFLRYFRVCRSCGVKIKIG